MAGCAARLPAVHFSASCPALNIVRSRILERRQCTIARCYSTPPGVSLLRNRNVTQNDDVIGPVVRKRVAADFELHPARVLNTVARVAIIAILVILRVADLAGEIRAVRGVILIFIADRMAIAAGRAVAHFVTVRVGRAVAVHFIRVVAAGALHCIRDVVYVSTQSFISALIFITDTAAVTRGALVAHVRRFADQVALHESAADGFRTADVAFAACRMTLVALLLELRVIHFIRANRLSGARFKHRVIALHCRMKARCPEVVRDRIVAARAGIVHTFGRIGNHTCMRSFLGQDSVLTAVTIDTVKRVRAIQKHLQTGARHQNFLPALQRRDRAASAFARIFHNRSGIGRHRSNQHFLTGVTAHTIRLLKL